MHGIGQATVVDLDELELILKGIEKQASGRQPRRAAFWKAQHIQRYVSIYKSRTTPDHGARRGF